MRPCGMPELAKNHKPQKLRNHPQARHPCPSQRAPGGKWRRATFWAPPYLAPHLWGLHLGKKVPFCFPFMGLIHCLYHPEPGEGVKKLSPLIPVETHRRRMTYPPEDAGALAGLQQPRRGLQ